jgi:hypothetical protein
MMWTAQLAWTVSILWDSIPWHLCLDAFFRLELKSAKRIYGHTKCEYFCCTCLNFGGQGERKWHRSATHMILYWHDNDTQTLWKFIFEIIITHYYKKKNYNNSISYLRYLIWTYKIILPLIYFFKILRIIVLLHNY